MSQLGNKLIIYAARFYAVLMQKKFLSKTKTKNCAVMLQAGVSHNSWPMSVCTYERVLPVYITTEKEREGRHIN